MLTTAKKIKGYKLNCIDGEIGSVKEFFFDDRFWAIRYLVVNTGSLFNKRQVLISPLFLQRVNEDSKLINVSLTKNQIENSPAIDNDLPVSRQYEESYFRYYGADPYWRGSSMWGSSSSINRDRDWSASRGTTSSTGSGMSSGSHVTGSGTTGGSHLGGSGMSGSGGSNVSGSGMKGSSVSGSGSEGSWDSNLQSSKDVIGHEIRATDGDIGQCDNFIIDDDSWEIRYMVLDTKKLLPGKKVLVSPQFIDRIDTRDKKVFVVLPVDSIKQAPTYDEDMLLTREQENRIDEYFHRFGTGTHRESGRRYGDTGRL